MEYMHKRFREMVLILMMAAPIVLFIITFAQAREPGFTETERVLIEEILEQVGVLNDDDYAYRDYSYAYDEPKGLPPGLAKKGKIPPGIAKQIAEGKRIPYGTVVYRDPDLLLNRLGQPHPGTYRAIIGNDYVLLERGTDIVIDVIRDVVGRS